MSNESAAAFLRAEAEKIEKHGGNIRLAYTLHFMECDGKSCKKHDR